MCTNLLGRCVLVYCGACLILCGRVTGYAAPPTSLQLYSNGSFSLLATFSNWTGYWASETTIAAGANFDKIKSLFNAMSAIFKAFCCCCPNLLCMLLPGLVWQDDIGQLWSSPNDFTLSISPCNDSSTDSRGKQIEIQTANDVLSI